MEFFGNTGGERVLRLEELARLIEGVISGGLGRGYWVKAEMARLNLYPESGHCYPDLVEKDGRIIKAQMRGTIWAGNYQRIAKQFIEVTREPLHDGLQILFFATVKFHPQYGLSLHITDIDPTYTLGQMARDRLETIRRLKEEGLFDKNRGLPFPMLPKRIAVISVQTSNGYSDFMKILQDQAPVYHYETVLFPALLQGDRAVESILSQLAAIRGFAGHFDLAAIIRGGGGDVGLSCYDDYRLAREVASFPIPVITGIGHSTNQTVVELVAARNKITPTDVAWSLVDHFRELDQRLREIREIVEKHCSDTFEDGKTALGDFANRLQVKAIHRMEAERRRLEDMLRDTLQKSRLRMQAEQRRLISSGTILRIGAARLTGSARAAIGHRQRLIAPLLTGYFTRIHAALALAESKITMLDPKNTLRRGYSITRKNGKPLMSATETQPGDEITTELYDGNIISIIQNKNQE